MPIEIAAIFFVWIIYSDLLCHEIPDKLTFPGMVLGIALNTWSAGSQGFLFSIEGLISGIIPIFISGLIGIVIWGKAGIGGGDVKLLAMIGAFYGPWVALLTYATYPILVAFWAFSFEEKKVPCAPFIIIACLYALQITGGLF